MEDGVGRVGRDGGGVADKLSEGEESGECLPVATTTVRSRGGPRGSRYRVERFLEVTKGRDEPSKGT